jgi:hypothetical protein
VHRRVSPPSPRTPRAAAPAGLRHGRLTVASSLIALGHGPEGASRVGPQLPSGRHRAPVKVGVNRLPILAKQRWRTACHCGQCVAPMFNPPLVVCPSAGFRSWCPGCAPRRRAIEVGYRLVLNTWAKEDIEGFRTRAEETVGHRVSAWALRRSGARHAPALAPTAPRTAAVLRAAVLINRRRVILKRCRKCACPRTGGPVETGGDVPGSSDFSLPRRLRISSRSEARTE